MQSFSQSNFQKVYGGTGNDRAYSIQNTVDGGYIIGGVTESFGSSSQDGYIVKTDGCGNTQWTSSYGSTSEETIHHIEQIHDGGYVATGGTSGSGAGFNIPYIIRLDVFGNILWSKNFQGIESSLDGGIVHETYDHGFILMARNDPNSDYYLIRTDSVGNLLWSKSFFNTAATKIGGGIIQTPDSGFLCTGFTSIPSFGVCAIKLDKLGYFQWSKIYANNSGIDESSYYAENTTDGGYAIFGQSNYAGAGQDNIYIIKTDSTGNLQWAKTYGIPGLTLRTYCGKQTRDGGYIVTGYNYNTPNADAFLIKADSSGNITWTTSYGTAMDDVSYVVAQTTDDGFVLAGWTNSSGAGLEDVYVIKTDSRGNTGCNQLQPIFTVTQCTPTITNAFPIETTYFNNTPFSIAISSNATLIRNLCLYPNPQFICSGYSYTINGNTYSSAGNYIDTLLTGNGCDSIVNTQLSVLSSSINAQTVLECDSFYWNGISYFSSGFYSDTLINSVGCDSILILDLSIGAATRSVISVVSCFSYIWNGKTYSHSGTYIDTTLNAFGCDSIQTLNLTIESSSAVAQNQFVCEGSTYSLNGHNYTSQGVYIDTLINFSGCDSLITTNLYVFSSPVIIAGPDTIIEAGTEIELHVSGGVSYLWNTGDTTANLFVKPMESITYFVDGEDSDHCHNVDSVYIIVEENYSVFIPNSFSPNHDGVNDEFTCYGICLEHFELTIYDRWGNEIYNSIDKPWDGRLNGLGVMEGVYIYKFKIKFCTGDERDITGHVTKIN